METLILIIHRRIYFEGSIEGLRSQALRAEIKVDINEGWKKK